MRCDIRAGYEKKKELVVTYKEIKNNLYGNRACFFIISYFRIGNRKDCLGSGKNESGCPFKAMV